MTHLRAGNSSRIVQTDRAVCRTACCRREQVPYSEEPIMKALTNLCVKLVKDEQGGEVLEYALIAGLIVVAAIAVITSVGGKVLARWTSLNSSL
jgi:pilus assembly protein Flp/PilA